MESIDSIFHVFIHLSSPWVNNHLLSINSGFQCLARRDNMQTKSAYAIHSSFQQIIGHI